MLSDEVIILSFHKHKNYSKTAEELGVSRELIRQRLGTMRYNGVEITESQAPQGQRRYKYTPERIAALNEFVKKLS